MELPRVAAGELGTFEQAARPRLAGGGGRGGARDAPQLVVDRLGKCFLIPADVPGGMTKLKREVWALRNVSFSLPSGTVLGVIGANGAGKTTLLRILARISLPTEGRVVGRGRVISLLSMGMGMDADQTGRENVLMEAALHRISRLEASRRLDRIVEFAELGRVIDTPMRHYSSGMVMRLAFSVAIHMDPDVLLADEVLAVGDAAFQDRCLERVKQAQQAGLTVVFVSHDMAAIRRISDQVLWLQQGRVAGLGPPEEIVDEYLGGSVTREAGSSGLGASNDAAAILGAEILKADGPADEIRTSDRFGVRIRLAVRSPAIRKARCSISLFVSGVHVFRSTQPGPLPVIGPGLYAATAWIPPHLLAGTTYDVNVKVIVSGDGAVSRLIQERALLVRVSDHNGSSGAKGLVAPDLEWTVETSRATPSTSG